MKNFFSVIVAILIAFTTCISVAGNKPVQTQEQNKKEIVAWMAISESGLPAGIHKTKEEALKKANNIEARVLGLTDQQLKELRKK